MEKAPAIVVVKCERIGLVIICRAGLWCCYVVMCYCCVRHYLKCYCYAVMHCLHCCCAEM